MGLDITQRNDEVLLGESGPAYAKEPIGDVSPSNIRGVFLSARRRHRCWGQKDERIQSPPSESWQTVKKHHARCHGEASCKKQREYERMRV